MVAFDGLSHGSYMSIVSKMSLALPVVFSWLYYGDAMGPWRGAGVLLALGAVFLINYRPESPVQLGSDKGPKWLTILLIIILFVGNGGNDILFKVFNDEFAGKVEGSEFTVVLFATSALAGILVHDGDLHVEQLISIARTEREASRQHFEEENP